MMYSVGKVKSEVWWVGSHLVWLIKKVKGKDDLNKWPGSNELLIELLRRMQ